MQIFSYFKEVKLELQKITWPTKDDALRMTTIVIASSLLIGFYIGGLDLLFTRLLGAFI